LTAHLLNCLRPLPPLWNPLLCSVLQILQLFVILLTARITKVHFSPLRGIILTMALTDQSKSLHSVSQVSMTQLVTQPVMWLHRSFLLQLILSPISHNQQHI
jgi:hypothetical protein